MDSGSGGKKKRLTIPIQQKLDALKRVDGGENIKKVSEELGIDTAYIKRWSQDRVKMEKWCAMLKVQGTQKDRARMRHASNAEIDAAVLIWYNQQRVLGSQVTGPTLRAQALKLYQEMGGDDDFVASDGWLSRWKQRHGIRQTTTCLSKLPPVDRRPLKNMLDEERLTSDQIFSTFETVLHYRTLPSKTLMSPERQCTDRVTVMCCSNAAGSLKLPLMVIGRSALERALDDINVNNLPVLYRSRKSYRMDPVMFKRWFDFEFVPRVTRYLKERAMPLKAIVLIDHTFLHPAVVDLKNGDIRAVFFPADINTLGLPMNHDLLKNLKRRYRYKFMASLLEAQDDGREIVEHLGSIRLKEVIFWLAEAWEGVDSSSIRKSWRWIWPECRSSHQDQRTSDLEDEEASIGQFFNIFQQFAICKNVDEENVRQWLKNDDILSDEEILQVVIDGDGEQNSKDEDDDERSGCNDFRDISHADAKDACELVLAYFEKQPDYPISDLMTLRRARDRAALNKMQQKTWKMERVDIIEDFSFDP